MDEDTDNLNSNYEIPKDMQGPIIVDEDTVNLNSNSEIYKDMQGPIIVDKVAEKLNSISKSPKDMQGGELSGLKFFNPKSTWTRIVRIDYGLGNVIKVVDVPLLGRIVCTHNTNLSIQCDEEET